MLDSIRTLIVNAGTAAGTRVAADILPEQTTMPCVRLSQIGGEVLLAMEAPAGMREYRIQITAFASTSSAARTLAEACRAALHYYAGTVSAVAIQRIIATSEPAVVFDAVGRAYQASFDAEVSING